MIGRNKLAQSEGRRRKVLPVSPELLAAIFTNGNIIHAECVQGLPPGAAFIGIAYDVYRDLFFLCFESQEWGAVPEGQELPWLPVIYRSVEVPDA